MINKKTIKKLISECKIRLVRKYDKWRNVFESGYTEGVKELYIEYAYERGYYMALNNIYNLIKSEDAK